MSLAQASQAPSALREALDLLKDPILLEVAVLVATTFVMLWLVLSVRASLVRLRGRRLLVKYLDGVEAALAGDGEAAAELLSAVVDADPENVGARLALGDALYQLQRPADAHEQHMEARDVFAAGGPNVELALARDLRAAGETAEAIERIDGALAEYPRELALLEEAWSLKSEAGMFEAALAAGRRVFERKRDEGTRRRLAVTAARAGMVSLRRGRHEHAEGYFRESLGYDSDNREARTGQLLLAPDGGVHLLARSEAGSAALAVTAAGTLETRSVEAILEFFPESICPDCASPRNAHEMRCGVCTSARPATYAERDLSGALANPDASLDEIEENEAWFRRLALDARAGDAGAAASLAGGGASGLPALLGAMLDAGDAGGHLLELCVQLGRQHPDALLAARDELKGEGRGVLDMLSGRPDIDPLLAPIFRRLGAPARPCFQILVTEGTRLGDRGLRELVVDYFVGLCELAPFEELAARYAPVEIIRKLNRIPPRELAPLLARMPDGSSFLREAILLDAALDQPEALVLAALHAGPDRVERWSALLRERGPSAPVLAGLVGELGSEPPRAAVAEALLAAFPDQALHHLVAGFADPDAREPARAALSRLLTASGARAVRELVRCFGSTPSEVDDRAIAQIASLGPDAVAPLEHAYRHHAGWLGKIGAKLMRRTHARSCIARALARIEGSAARASLERLVHGETDVELISLLRELLRRHGTRVDAP